MGIFGFGFFKNKFSKNIRNVALNNSYVAFDITHITVQALHNCTNCENFIQIFKLRFESSFEVKFLKRHKPMQIIFALDNRSPNLKRQTQQRRFINRLTLNDRIGKAILPPDVTPPSILQTSTEISPEGKNNKTTVETTVAVPPSQKEEDNLPSVIVPKLKIRDVASLIENYILGTVRSEFFPQTHVLFDGNEGEGEMKIMKRLEDSNDCVHIIMSRDNDVFVYILSLKDRLNTEQVYIFYEQTNSFNLLRCWDNVESGYAWVLVLWLGICYGNDYTLDYLKRM